MLDKPDLADEELISCLQSDYGLSISQIAFLPLGADANTAVYRAVADDEIPYFVKLRRGGFDELSVAVPRLLRERGIPQIIAPIATRSGRFWTRVNTFTVILYPFVDGHDGVERHLTDRHWVDLGSALRGIHATAVPQALRQHIPHETYAPRSRDAVRAFQTRVEETDVDDPIAIKVAALLRDKRDTISDLVARAEHLADVLQERSLDHVLCHGDIHAANVLIDASDKLFIVDWDTLILAPKERDLMFIGAGIAGVWRTAREETLFYRGYGQTEIDPVALAYYRYERIVEDIAAFCEQLLLTDEGEADREQALRYLASQFLPDSVIEIAYRTDSLLRAE